MSARDGMIYSPRSAAQKAVCGPGEFIFAAAALDHGHIYGMCGSLIAAGAELRWVYDKDPEKIKSFIQRYPGAKAARSLEEILQDSDVKMVAAAAIPSERSDLGLAVMDAGKDYFTDKTPFTTLDQLEAARRKTKETGQKYMVYYSERLHVESAVYAGQLIDQGAIGRVIQVMGTGPHRLNAASRPDWFFRKSQYGGILCDIGSHQVEQFLSFSSCQDAKVMYSRAVNLHHPAYPELEDFGEASLVGNNGASGYFRVDWFTPNGLSTWGDGRTTILGTDGYIELRKYTDIAREQEGDQVYLVNHEGEYRFGVKGKVGYPFFGQLILDCLHRTENAMTQDHAFKAAELCLIAQQQAEQLTLAK